MGYYKRTGIENRLTVSSLISFHYFEYIRDYEGITESHDFCELVYIDYGRVKVISGEDEYFLSSGEGFIHAPDEPHGILSAGDFASTFIISFDCECGELSRILSRVLRFGNAETELIRRIYAAGQNVFEGPYDIFDQQKLRLKDKAPYGGMQIVKDLLELLLLHLVEGVPTGTAEQGRRFDKDSSNERVIVDRIIEVLLENVYGRITLDEICAKLSFSKSYILRVFKKRMDCGVMDYYNQMKIKEAKRLISQGRYTYTEIARMLNYSSVHHFSRNFKLVTNMTPSGYQKSVKNQSVI